MSLLAQHVDHALLARLNPRCRCRARSSKASHAERETSLGGFFFFFREATEASVANVLHDDATDDELLAAEGGKSRRLCHISHEKEKCRGEVSE